MQNHDNTNFDAHSMETTDKSLDSKHSNLNIVVHFFSYEKNV